MMKLYASNRKERRCVCVIEKQALGVSELVKVLEEIPENGEIRKVVQLTPDRYLNDKEHAAYMKDFIGVMNDVISRVIFIADKHNVDRDNAIRHFAAIFKVMTEISTFERWNAGSPDGAQSLGEQFERALNMEDGR